MQAAVFHAPGDVRIEEIPEPVAGPGEVVVRIRKALTCGTDLKIYRRGHPTIMQQVPTPFGHEFAGDVVALGAGVEGSVLVWFGVAPDGSIIDKEALDGPPELMEWVLERVDRLVERPALVADRPVRGWVALEIHFSRASAEEARARAAAEQARPAAVTAK